MEEFVEESYREFIMETKADWEGLSYNEYISYLFFLDAFVDLIEKEEPGLGEEIGLDVSAPMYKRLTKQFKSKGLDIDKFIDWSAANRIEKSINLQFKDKMTLAYIARWNSKFLKVIVNNTIGRGSLTDEPQVVAMLKNQKVPIPDLSHLGATIQEKSFDLAAKAIALIKSKSDLKESIDTKAMNARRDAVMAVLRLQRHFPKDQELDYIIAYLERMK